MESKKSTKPEKVFSRRGIIVSVFRYENEVDGRPLANFKMTIRRLYTDDEGKTQSTYYLGMDDWPTADALSRLAWAYTLEQSLANDEAKPSKSEEHEAA